MVCAGPGAGRGHGDRLSAAGAAPGPTLRPEACTSASAPRSTSLDSLDTAPATFDWMSAEFVLQKPAAIGAAKVEFDQAYYADMAALIAAEIAGSSPPTRS